MTKPTVFNYQEYLDLLDTISEHEAEILDLREKNDRLKEKVANLGIRCRIAEEALTESQKKLLNLAMDHNLLQLTINRTWIPVDEKLPEIDEPVIVCWDDGKITDGYLYCEDSWFCAWGEYNGWHRKGRDKRIIAWMPLPEPYREDGEA